MRKKVCAFLVTVFSLLYGSTIGAAETVSQPGENSDATAIDIIDNVLVISQDDLYGNTNYNTFLENEGIIVVLQGKENSSLLDEKANKSSGNMIKIATLYYNYLNAVGIRDIYVEDIDETEHEVIIAEEVGAVRTKIENQSQNIISDEDADAMTYLGEYTNLYIYKPKMKVETDYDFYTVQDYLNGKDYYFIKGNIIGNSGRAMTDLNEKGYKSKYETDNLTVTFESKTPGFTREEYAPSFTKVGSDRYLVNIGKKFYRTENANADFSSSYGIVDTEISALSTIKKTIWTVKYKDGKDSQKRTSEFHPAIAMSCPDSTGSVQMYIETSFQVDSWNTLPVSRNFGTTITFYPDRISVF